MLPLIPRYADLCTPASPCVRATSAAFGKMHRAGQYILRLGAICGALTASLYCQQPAAVSVARPEIRSNQLCNVEVLRCDPSRLSSLQGNGALELGSLTLLGSGGPDHEREGRPTGDLWASFFPSDQQAEPLCCELDAHSDGVGCPSEFARNAAFCPGFGSISLTAWNQQNSAADRKQHEAATQGSPKHIFLIVPAFHVTYLKTFKPMTPREKFDEWLQGTYDPRGLGLYAAESATLEHSSKDGFCGYGKGLGNYGKCFGATELDANISSFLGDFLFPVIMHQDPRYFRLGHGSFGKRVGYAMSRVFVTHADSGRTVFFASALSGSALGAAASNLYYPVQDRGFGHTLSRMTLDLGNTALFNAAAEFWPDIQQKLHDLFGRR